MKNQPTDQIKCVTCKQAKPREEFFILRGDKLVYSPRCEDCRAGLSGETEQDRKLRMKVSRYGLTVAQYNAMLVASKGNCQLCGKPLPKTRINIDHDHKTNKVRGLLCVRCNSGIGFFFDDPAYMRQAIAYIEHYAAM